MGPRQKKEPRVQKTGTVNHSIQFPWKTVTYSLMVQLTMIQQ